MGSTAAPSRTTDLDRNGNLKYHVDFRQVYASVLETWLRADASQIMGYDFPNLHLFDGAPGGGSTGAVLPHRRRRLRLTS